MAKDSRLTRAGVSGYNKPKRTPNHPKKSHVVVAKSGDQVKTIRFGQQGASTAGKPKAGESARMKAKRKSFKARHGKNIAKGKMSAAYWANKGEMVMTTYLDVVNNVLKRLRERTVSTVNESTYSTLIATLVNDAKETTENAWSWSGLRTTLTATTSSDVFSYELNGTLNRLTVLDVMNDTANSFMLYRTAHEFNQFFLGQTPTKGTPNYYSFNGISADGDTKVDIYPIPDGVYDLRFNVVLRTDDVTSDADTFSIPTKPIELLTYAMAVEERGEDGGINPVSAYARANNALQDAIGLDAAKHPEETIWYES